ncbi:hypothetical protein MAH1_20190 [Sessilibacter sp. MAH1]
MEISIANENRRLREIVQQLLDRIDEQQKTHAHFQKFQTRLLHSQSFSETVNLLLDDACRHFRLASSSLILHDADGHIEEMISACQIDLRSNRLQLRKNADFYKKIYPEKPQVMLQEIDVLTATRLFPGTPKVGSAAFLPLLNAHGIFGSLHFASSDEKRFVSAKDTNLLDHLADVASLSLRFSFSHEQQWLASLQDPVLQIGNAQYFEKALHNELDRARREHSHLACMMLVVEAEVSDIDLTLQKLVQELKANIRKIDICARIDEVCLAVLMPGTDLRQAQGMLSRIEQSILALQLEHNVAMGVHSWKARKTKSSLSEDALKEAGVELITTAKNRAYG